MLAKPADGDLWVEYGLMVVRSPKGSGKTEYIAARVRRLRALGAKVLIITYRRSLAAALASRLGLTNYLRHDGRTFNQPTDAFVVVLDSLLRIDPVRHKYDVVIVDESESVIRHLLSDTLKDHRREVLDLAQHFLARSTCAMFLDADAGQLTLRFAAEVLKDAPRSTLVIDNQWRPTGRTIGVYADRRSPRQAVGDLVSALERGERCYVACNSRSDAELLATEIPKHVHGRDLRVMCVTAGNSQDEDVLHFIKNISAEILNYDAVIVSPAVSSGIDITFDGDAAHVHAVFGIFRGLVTTHFEIDQQLGRVRNPGTIKVWIAADEFAFESDPGVIQAEIWAAEEQHHVRLGYLPNGEPQFLPSPLYDAVFVTATAEERASKNRLRRNFIDHRRRSGWQVEEIGFDGSAAEIGAAILRDGKAAAEVDRAEGLIQARVLSAGEYAELRERAKRQRDLTARDESAMRRYEIESFFGVSISPELIDFDDQGRGRRMVENMEALLASEEEVAEKDRREAKKLPADRGNWVRRQALLRRALSAAGLFADGQVREAATVDQSMLGAFVIVMSDGETQAGMQRVLGLVPRKDAHRMPARQLSEVLKLVGLKTRRSHRVRAGGADRIAYKLDAERLAVVIGHVERRREMRRRRKAEGD